MGTPLGDFIRAKRDATLPSDLGLPDDGRRRAPGLRRMEIAARAGISVEYLTRIEQGRDRNPTTPVLNAIADGLSLDASERRHLSYLAKIAGGACAGQSQRRLAPARQVVQPSTRATLDLLEPGAAMVTNGLGDVLAHTQGFERLMRPLGLFDADTPNLTRYVFTDPRARSVLPDWAHAADEQAFNLWMAPTAAASEWFKAELAPLAGQDFTSRLDQHLPPRRLPWLLIHPAIGRTVWDRQVLALADDPDQQIVVFLPADETTREAFAQLGAGERARLRAV